MPAWITLLIICFIINPVEAKELSIVVNGHAAHLGTLTKYQGTQREVVKTVHPYGWTTYEAKEVPVYTDYNFNELNMGIGYEYKLDRVYLTAGEYTDSFYQRRYYGGIGKKLTFYYYHGFEVQGGVVGGLMNHTEFKAGEVPFPFALPWASVGYKGVHLRTTYVPKLRDSGVAFQWFQVVIDL